MITKICKFFFKHKQNGSSSVELVWSNLFCGKRVRDVLLDSDKVFEEIPSIRNKFDEDYDRIIYSSSLRRLQDKTQVFPLQQNDFIRTRLTHSLEVAALGESIAWQIVEKLRQKEGNYFYDHKDNLYELKKLSSLVKVACLVHDLGNPPFGHYGEDVIKKWFKNYFKQNKHLNLTSQQKYDFLHFDGNAQNIHILSKLQFLNDEFGMNFTLATLATLMKYPYASNNEFAKSKKKFGFLSSEQAIFEKIQEETGVGVNGIRHPATYIIEAADDIAYKIADLEDAVKKGIISWDVFYSDIKESLDNLTGNNCSQYPYKDRIESNSAKDIPNKDLIQFQNFKVFLQGTMVLIAIDNFVNHYDEIMLGTYKNSKGEIGHLLDNDLLNRVLEKIEVITYKYCFANPEVLELELRGDKVISDLLDLFVPAVLTKDTSKTKSKEQKLVNLISENFAYVQCLGNIEPESGKSWKASISQLTDYQKLQIVVDFISGMTDSYAVNLHQRLRNTM